MAWSDTCLHPLDNSLPRPQHMNDPLCYEPHPVCLAAMDDLLRQPQPEAFADELARGKMLGVLVVADAADRLCYLAAFSGQVADSAHWPGFVPPVFDYLQPDGHFRREEARITSLNRQIQSLEQSPDRLAALHRLQEVEAECRADVTREAGRMRMAKQLRDQRRREGFIAADEQAAMTRQSQFRKAELRRVKQRCQERVEAARVAVQPFEERLQALRRERRTRSDELQSWLFEQFRMANAQGERRTLTDIFAQTALRVPPSGAGECCEPKLLQYAYLHQLRPVQMAMQWQGASPRQEIRHHGQYYPACRGKCKPILEWMLPPEGQEAGSKEQEDSLVCCDHVATPPPSPLPQGRGPGVGLTRLYSDPHIAVLSKPAGLLTVPGRGGQPSVYAIARAWWPEAEGPLIVHRLDQDTSGLLVIAKTKAAHRHLQAQFLARTVRKRYVAILDPAPAHHLATLPRHGRIALPLRPDPLNRPYQLVDHALGKPALTTYHLLSASPDGWRVALTPHTGRTHQLRMHCAHAEGLACPIKGDPLYGHPATRLFLHAARLSFVHPATRQRLTFNLPPEF